MYGKAYSSQYEGSMIGLGLNVFAVWNYCIAKNRSGSVELNPKLLAFIFGTTEEEVVDAIEKLMAPDPKSRSKEAGGRRLIKEGQFQYRMVNWAYYDSLRCSEDLREYNRRKQAEYRARSKPLKGEVAAIKAAGNGDMTTHDRIAATPAVSVPQQPTRPQQPLGPQRSWPAV